MPEPPEGADDQVRGAEAETSGQRRHRVTTPAEFLAEGTSDQQNQTEV